MAPAPGAGQEAQDLEVGVVLDQVLLDVRVRLDAELTARGRDPRAIAQLPPSVSNRRSTVMMPADSSVRTCTRTPSP